MITGLYVFPAGRACRYRADFPHWMHAKEKKTKGPSRLKIRHDLQVSTSNDVVHETYFNGVPRDLDDINDTLKAILKSEKTVVFAEDDPDYLQLTRMCNEEGVDGGIKAHAIFARSFKLMSSFGAYELKKKMAQDLLEIVEGNGEAVHATDDTRVIFSALFSWSFVATFFLERFDFSLFDGGMARHALNTFINLLHTESVQVKAAACQAIGLIYEAERLVGIFPDISMDLWTPQHVLAPNINGFLHAVQVPVGLSTEPTGPDDPRLLTMALDSLRHALVNNRGPIHRNPIIIRDADGFYMWYETISVPIRDWRWQEEIRALAVAWVFAATGITEDKCITEDMCWLHWRRVSME